MRPDELFSLLRPEFRPDPPQFFQNEFVLEVLFWIIALALTWVLLKTRPGWLERIEKLGAEFARKRTWTVIAVMFTSLALRAALLPFVPIPEPVVHDEYSYLLQAATFASGRVTNPTPAGWTHFETFHENMVPTYQSMYPPAQAIFLAGAEVLHLHPWWGVWFSIGLMCGAICWMMQGWMPPQWALLGALFCVIRFSTFSYWINSYFGGALAATGGALVFGALPRLRHGWKPLYSVIFALGLGLMANTRAYEGFVFSIPAVIAVLCWFFSDWKYGRVRMAALVPGIAALLLIAAGMGYYNWRNTGNPLLLPYVVNQRQYHITKPFIWQARYPIPNYRHQVMRTFYVFHELPDYLNRRNPGFYKDMVAQRLEVYYDYYLWPLLAVAILGIWEMVKNRKMRIVAFTPLFMLAGLLIEQWPPEGHYAAPVLSVVIAVILYGLRIIWTWNLRKKPFGHMLVRSIVLLLLLWSFVPLANTVIDPYGLGDVTQMKGSIHSVWIPTTLERARLQATLERIPGQHILFINLKPHEISGMFWIYNAPDVAHSKIIWAYDEGPAANQELIRLYPNRHLWWVNKTDNIMPLLPYPPAPEITEALLAQYQEEAHER